MSKSLRKNSLTGRIPIVHFVWGGKEKKERHGEIRANMRDYLKEELKYENSGDAVLFEQENP